MLKDKVVVVTGGSRGIGKAISRAFIDRGSKVIVTYNKDVKSGSWVEEYTGDVTLYQLDVANIKSIEEILKQIERKYGHIDVLVNNAGINSPNDFDLISEEEWDSVLDVNLKGVFLLSQKFMPLINSGGNIVNISSVSGQYGGPRSTHYAVSKAGLNCLTQNMAIFCASKNIRVNAVSPGLIESEMAKAATKLGVADKILLQRLGHPEEVAEAVLFLASDAASYITAQIINVNGGLYF